MPVTLTQDEFNTFKQHGATAESIQNTVNHYRSQGLDDTAIRAKIDAKLNSWATPVQPQPKNVVPNRPANQELKVQEQAQELNPDAQPSATQLQGGVEKKYVQQDGYIVDTETGEKFDNSMEIRKPDDLTSLSPKQLKNYLKSQDALKRSMNWERLHNVIPPILRDYDFLTPILKHEDKYQATHPQMDIKDQITQRLKGMAGSVPGLVNIGLLGATRGMSSLAKQGAIVGAGLGASEPFDKALSGEGSWWKVPLDAAIGGVEGLAFGKGLGLGTKGLKYIKNLDRKIDIAKKRDIPVIQRMSDEQLERATNPNNYKYMSDAELNYATMPEKEMEAYTRPDVEPTASDWGVNNNNIDSQAIANQFNEGINKARNEIQTFTDFSNNLKAKYGSIDNLRKIVAEDVDEFGKPKSQFEAQMDLDNYLKMQDELTNSTTPYLEQAGQIDKRFKQLDNAVEVPQNANKYVEPVADPQPQVQNVVPQPQTVAQPVVPQVQRVMPTPAKQQPIRLTNKSVTKQAKVGKADAVVDTIGEQDIPYDTLPNQVLIDKANALISKDANAALSNIMAKKKNQTDALDVETGRQLLDKLYNEGRVEEATNLVEKLANDLVEAGRTVQAMSLWKRTTPEGAEMLAQKYIDKYNKTHKKKIVLTPEQRLKIRELANNITTAEDKDFATGLMLKEVANIIPPSAVDKIKTFTNMALLGNIKTFNRNLISNAIMMPLETTAKSLAYPFDLIASKVTGKQTVAPFQLGTYLKAFPEATKKAIKNIANDIQTGNTSAKYDMPRTMAFRGGNTERTTFKDIVNGEATPSQYWKDLFPKSRVGQAISKKSLEPLKKIPSDALNFWEKALNYSLRLGDEIPREMMNQESIANQILAQKLDTATPQILKDAEREAAEAVFQDNSVTAEIAQNLKRILNLNKEIGLGDIALKYPRTPGNIVQRGMDYSPLGYIKAGIDAIKNKDQRKAVMDMARATVGTGIIASIANAVKNGADIKGDIDDYQEKQNLQALGIRPHTINGFSYNQYQPLSTLIATGTALANPSKKGPVDDAMNNLLDMSMMQPINKFVNDVQRKSWGDALVNLATSGTSQFVPTLLKQANAYIDDTERETYGPKGIEGLNRAAVNIPGISKMYPAKTDIKGEVIKKYPDSKGIKKFYDVFINPSFENNKKDDPILEEIIRLNSKETKTLLPVAEKKLSFDKADGTKFEGTLTRKDYVAYKNKLGKASYKSVEDIMNTPLYQLSSDEEKANMINKALKETKDLVQQDVLNKAKKIQAKKYVPSIVRQISALKNKTIKNIVNSNYDFDNGEEE